MGSPGAYVAAAQEQKWQRLQTILESRTFDSIGDADDDDGEEAEDTENGMLLENQDDSQELTLGTPWGQNCDNPLRPA